jgi:predicted metal-dependent hydrolase
MRFLRREIFADGQRLEVAGHPVRLKVSARARQVSLRVDRVNREVTAVAPTARRLADAADFARERQGWIAAQMAALPEPQSLAIGDEISLFGQPCRLETGSGRARLLAADGDAPARIVNCGPEALDLWMAGRVIRREADRVFAERVAHHCDVLGAPLPSVKTADATGRWGSCTPARAERRASIRLSWRLALAPFDVADYVVAHEVAHLKEANHGPRFWALVRDLVGDPKPHRAWLRAEGPRLHAFGR